LVTAVENVKEPFVEIVRLLPLLSCRTSPVPLSPETVPPMVEVVEEVVLPLPAVLPEEILQADRSKESITTDPK